MRFGLTEILLQCSYDKSAYLNAVCFLSVKGSMECSLPVGTYTLSWRFALDKTSSGFTRGWGKLPIEFAMSVNDHVTVETYGFFPDCQSSSEAKHSSDDEDQEEADTDWNEYYVGDFTVEEGEEDSGMGRVKLDYSLVHTKSRYWKRGLWLDGVVIMPKNWLRYDGVRYAATVMKYCRTRNRWMVS